MFKCNFFKIFVLLFETNNFCGSFDELKMRQLSYFLTNQMLKSLRHYTAKAT